MTTLSPAAVQYLSDLIAVDDGENAPEVVVSECLTFLGQ